MFCNFGFRAVLYTAIEYDDSRIYNIVAEIIGIAVDKFHCKGFNRFKLKPLHKIRLYAVFFRTGTFCKTDCNRLSFKDFF